VDGTSRSSECLAVRRSDIFVATAWWTALISESLIDQQARIFDSAKMEYIYLIQDYECGFYPWSTRSALAESTYKSQYPSLKIVNTSILADYFKKNGYFEDCLVYNPPINSKIQSVLRPVESRDRNVLIYMRPAAFRNCLEFADAVVAEAVEADPSFWRDWRFIAIGEDFDPIMHTKSGSIECKGRLTLEEYGNLISTSAVGLSLMLSPHPSYPPLEMAAAGMKVITNNYANKDLSTAHTNIHSFDRFCPIEVSSMMRKLCQASMNSRASLGSSKIDWFFDENSNIKDVINSASARIKLMLT
jgi:hypothetical protein